MLASASTCGRPPACVARDPGAYQGNIDA